MDNNRISRTGERILGIIGIVFNVIGIILLAWLITSISSLEGTPEFEQFQQEIMNDPAFEGNPQEAQMIVDFIMDTVGVFGWAIVAMLVLSTILAVVAVINLKRTGGANLAGIFFILAGLLAGVLSLTSILFYIAAIMCFVRKPPMREDELYRKEDPVYHGDTVRRGSDPIDRQDGAPRTRTDDMLRKEDTRRSDDDTPYRPL
ncbi:DUF4064 domain-containing protein [Planococcus sp. CAU13]|uniref:DUF4064 domain-containing protein n=1 Tax=Planococcus sp. CAU13 TaxID=1541197 RepID=UPI00052FE47E|nr:DUF4064 domain-containing protein [Planococcus sp. CAU13]